MDTKNMSMKALGTLIAGILGLTLLPLIGSIGAIVLAGMANSELANNPSLEGKGMVKAGRIMGYIGLGLGLCGCLFTLVSFVFAGLGQASTGFIPSLMAF
ncbi:MAG TPA: hypothetical protein PKM21_11425 [Anaerolineales bacterium]|nr:hypothetical protein [Anaerolineales bacterium]